MSCPKNAPGCATARGAMVLRFTLCFAIALLLAGARAGAQTLDLSLNVLYSNPSDASSGGQWQLVAKSSGSGIAAVDALVTGIPAETVVNRAPFGTVNGNDAAGFFISQVAPNPLGYVHILAGQAPLGPERQTGEEEAIFYGVGTMANAQPGTVGPQFTSLTEVQNSPWATGDVFSDPAWNTAALLASGTFPMGLQPAFFSSGENISQGSIFSSLGSATSAGDIDFDPVVTTLVRSNLMASLDGDYDDSGLVGQGDLDLVLLNWGDAAPPTPPGWINQIPTDGLVSQNELDPVLLNWGEMLGAGSLAATAVPEPTACILLGVAGALLASGRCGRRLRRRKTS